MESKKLLETEMTPETLQAAKKLLMERGDRIFTAL